MTVLWIYYCCLVSSWQEEKNNNLAEIILVWLNMWTYENICVAHARRVGDVLSDEYC